MGKEMALFESTNTKEFRVSLKRDKLRSVNFNFNVNLMFK
jgi:hypothetical protein